jgi:hypothetical protein
MTVQQFAEKYRLKVTREPSGDEQGDYRIIQGRLYKDANISEHDNGMLAMCWLTEKSHAKKFNSVKRVCLSAGMTIAQEGDDEAIFLFNPENDEQAKLAIQSIRAKVRKVLSPEALAKLLSVGYSARKPTQTTSYGV